MRQHKESLDFNDGPAISNKIGKVLLYSNVDDSLHEIFEDIWNTCAGLFPDSIN